MIKAKDIFIAPISKADADKTTKRFHYSGKSVNNSNVNFGVFANGILEGSMQFGPSIDKRKILPLVEGTKWNEMLELNRMAFGPNLPKNSESRALGVALRIIKKKYPFMKWIISFADATQCGDGTIYRASNFKLIGIKKNASIKKTASGEIFVSHGKSNSKLDKKGSKALDGFQICYIYFLDKESEKNLTKKILDYSEIEKAKARMYLGKKSAAKA